MNSLQKAFKKPGTHLIPFITAGDPNVEVTESIIELLEEEGVTAIELGVPFSEPVADGPTIQAASQRALENGVKLMSVLDLARRVREKGCQVPLILFSYYNPLLQYGLERLIGELAEIGFQGMIIPDLPFEESGSLRQWAKNEGIAVIPLVAPTSRQRIEMIVEEAEGFVYCISSLGTTGQRSQFDEQIFSFLQTVRQASPVPIAVGFGISSPEQVARFSSYSDAVIVGSSLVERIHQLSPTLMDPARRDEGLEEVRRFVRHLKSE
ncbi:tryptophan synthase subunit alpha [Hazenella coriacea]|uniref:Tryptophan synthase alpha chain n=1 Tax=Hazenella coriacea TaxID=1179467 RepID=A0A4R3L5G0_9BACL|nr:tryptophan synthase subunit alpha [Hazenella coriacea]TCS93384.1 tryptophan synthase alpha chain [Hazenella coriacea]